MTIPFLPARLVRWTLYFGGAFILFIAVVILAEYFATRPQIILGSGIYSINHMEWSHDGKRLALVEQYGGMRLLDLITGREVWRNGIQDAGNPPYEDVVLRGSVQWSDDDNLLFAHYESGGIDVIEASNGKTIHRLPECKTLLRWNKDGTFICGSESGPEEKWSSHSWSKISSLPAESDAPAHHSSEIRNCSGDGFTVVTNFSGPGVIWQGSRRLPYSPGEVARCVFLPGTANIAISRWSDSDSVVVIDRVDGRVIHSLPFRGLASFAISPDGQVLAIGKNDVTLVDLKTWKETSKSAFYFSDWITLSTASRYYVSSEEDGRWGSVTFDTFLPSNYPLDYYGADLRRQSLQDLWEASPRPMHPQVFRLAVDSLRQLSWKSLFQLPGSAIGTCVAAYGSLPDRAKPFVWPFLLGVLLCIFLTALWTFRPALLTEYALRSDIPVKFPIWKRLQDWVTLAVWLGHRTRPLDAWLKKNEEHLLRQCFTDRNSVKNRSTYVDLGNEVDSQRWESQISNITAGITQIVGPGGCGKTTLAVEWGRRAKSASLDHPVIPIIVDEDWQDSLPDYLSRSLAARDQRPTAAMIARLGRSGRLVPIIDGLSERRAEGGAVNQVLKLATEDRFRTILVTSRSPIVSQSVTTVEVGPLVSDRLRMFVGSYVSKIDQQNEILFALAGFSRGQPVRPLFAKLAIDQFAVHSALPASIAELIQDYILALRPAGGLRQDDLLRAARLAARACVWEHLIPLEVSTEYLKGQIAAEAAKSPFMDEAGVSLSSIAIVDQLLSCGLLQKSFILATMRVKFSLDPIAEYLVAMDAVATGGATLLVLVDRIEAAGTSAGGLGEIIRQLMALEGSRRSSPDVGATVP